MPRDAAFFSFSVLFLKLSVCEREGERDKEGRREHKQQTLNKSWAFPKAEDF